MPNEYFQFKQFTVNQDRCAMKVGTDGTLLGAWVNLTSCKTILDIGTGTGLIALMIAQRNNQAIIDAIDIDKDAGLQARENISKSPFSERINIYPVSLQTFVYNAECTYDLIVSNPPYFSNSLKSDQEKRNLARHNDTLPLFELFNLSRTLLNPDGRIAIIYPHSDMHNLFDYTQRCNLHCIRQTNVIPIEGGHPKRILIEFSQNLSQYFPEELILEKKRNQRTKSYQELMQDYYL